MARVLVLGAGGIGCEIIKNLLLLPENEALIEEIGIVDMDIVELSNLNRQFIYTSRDVGSYKTDVVQRWIKDAFLEWIGRIKGFSRRIQDLPRQFYQSYHLIISCLDSLEARVWINTMVMEIATTGDVIPLVDTGSEGFKGHACLVIPGVTACIECLSPLFTEDRLPICSIAGIPSSLEQCVEYAAYVKWPRLNDIEYDLDSEQNLLTLAEMAIDHARVHNVGGADLISTVFVKSVLDRVIPALSTTNSVIAGVSTIWIKQLLTGLALTSGTRNFVFYNGEQEAYLNSICIDRNPDCKLCGKIG